MKSAGAFRETAQAELLDVRPGKHSARASRQVGRRDRCGQPHRGGDLRAQRDEHHGNACSRKEMRTGQRWRPSTARSSSSTHEKREPWERKGGTTSSTTESRARFARRAGRWPRGRASLGRCRRHLAIPELRSGRRALDRVGAGGAGERRAPLRPRGQGPRLPQDRRGCPFSVGHALGTMSDQSPRRRGLDTQWRARPGRFEKETEAVLESPSRMAWETRSLQTLLWRFEGGAFPAGAPFGQR
jgi:hypothetical protein